MQGLFNFNNVGGGTSTLNTSDISVYLPDADSTGVSDAGADINAASLSAYNAGGGVVKLKPNATYLIETPLLWYPKVSIEGYNSTLKAGATVANVLQMQADMDTPNTYFNYLKGLNIDLSIWTLNDYAFNLGEEILFQRFYDITVTGRALFKQGFAYMKPAGSAQFYYHYIFHGIILNNLFHNSGAICIDSGPTSTDVGNHGQFYQCRWTGYKIGLLCGAEQATLRDCIFNIPVNSLRLGPRTDTGWRYACSRSNDTTLLVNTTTDKTANFPAGKLLYIQHADGSYSASTIQSSSFSSPNTVVVLIDAIVTASPAPSYTWTPYNTSSDYHPFSGDSVPIVTFSERQVKETDGYSELNVEGLEVHRGWMEGGAAITTYDQAPVLSICTRPSTAGFGITTAYRVFGVSNRRQLLEPLDSNKYIINAATSRQVVKVATSLLTIFPIGTPVFIWNIDDNYFGYAIVTAVSYSAPDTSITLDRPVIRNTSSIGNTYIWKVPMANTSQIFSNMDLGKDRYTLISETVTTSLQLTAKHTNSVIYVDNSTNNVTVNLMSGDTASEGVLWVKLIKGGTGYVTIGVPAGYYLDELGSGVDIGNYTAETNVFINLKYQRVSRWQTQEKTGTWGYKETFTGTAGETLSAFNAVYFKSDGKYWKSDANSVTTMPVVGLATAAITADAVGAFVSKGLVYNTAWNWVTLGGPIYASGTTGTLTEAIPSASGDQVSQVGIVVTADSIYFDPAMGIPMIEVA